MSNIITQEVVGDISTDFRKWSVRSKSFSGWAIRYESAQFDKCRVVEVSAGKYPIYHLFRKGNRIVRSKGVEDVINELKKLTKLIK